VKETNNINYSTGLDVFIILNYENFDMLKPLKINRAAK
jgi:hypothetical protein